ncbi:hypothetical protein LEP1GSC161_3790 [Leptospira santarosai str. CBC1416]|uniref:Uncharacterized protein n=1 Tax=Leptospira santarosai str. CBC1416 TaxID=1193059 RepID=M6W4G7_9LEPT|nr:hypothetical protein LEP1GSC168_3951 [Leptospira santarosai str. HAI134]EMO56688.1 hypothetical protein LEP1GSC161_3790 [Leptospira santarosai str. CBC1416]EMP79353.1 hypothetical protein LEP1GSC162_0398 [Leptospira santarosai str. CBC1531]
MCLEPLGNFNESFWFRLTFKTLKKIGSYQSDSFDKNAGVPTNYVSLCFFAISNRFFYEKPA